MRRPWLGWDERKLWRWGGHFLATGRFPEDLESTLAEPDETGWAIPPLPTHAVGGVFLEDAVADEVVAAIGPGHTEDVGGISREVEWHYGEPRPRDFELLSPPTFTDLSVAADPGPVFYGREVTFARITDLQRPLPVNLVLELQDEPVGTAEFDPLGWDGAEVAHDTYGFPIVSLYRRWIDQSRYDGSRWIRQGHYEWCRVERTVIGAEALQPSFRGARERDCLITRFGQEDAAPLHHSVIDDAYCETLGLPKSYPVSVGQAGRLAVNFSVEFEVSPLPDDSETRSMNVPPTVQIASPSKDAWTFELPGTATYRGVTFAVPEGLRNLLRAFASSRRKVLNEDAVRAAVARDQNSPPEWSTVRTYFSQLRRIFRENYECPIPASVIQTTAEGGRRFVTLNDDLLRSQER